MKDIVVGKECRSALLFRGLSVCQKYSSRFARALMIVGCACVCEKQNKTYLLGMIVPGWTVALRSCACWPLVNEQVE